MTYIEECYEALDEEITGMIKRLRSLYAGGERFKEVCE